MWDLEAVLAMSMRGNANLLEEYLKVNYMWLRRLCKSKDFRARLSFNLALVWGVALAETSRYLYNLVQTQAGPSTVRVRTPALSRHAPHRSALTGGNLLLGVPRLFPAARDML